MAESTAIELKKAGVPTRIIYIEDDSPKSAIKLMTSLLLEVSLIESWIGINPFNQPAVEKSQIESKKYFKKYE